MRILTYLRIHYDSLTASKQWQIISSEQFLTLSEPVFVTFSRGCTQCDTAPLTTLYKMDHHFTLVSGFLVQCTAKLKY